MKRVGINLESIKSIFKNKFARNVAVIAGGTAFAQLINMIFSPVITRLYTPEEYGVLTVYVAVLGILATVGSLKYEWAITIADDEEMSFNVLMLSIFILVFFVVTLTLALLIGGDKLLIILKAEGLADYIYYLPLGMLLIGLYNILRQWAFKERNFRAISKTKLSQTITQNLTKIVFGLLSVGPIGLILGNIFGQSAGITTLSIPILKKRNMYQQNVSLKKMSYCAKRYIKFPIYSASSQLFNAAGIQLPTIFMTTLYGGEMVGYYGLTSSIINIPMILIGNSIGDVFYSEAANVGRKDPKMLKILSMKLFRRLFLIGLVPLFVLIIWGPFLFSFVFGQSWYNSGIYAQIMSFLVFARLIFTPISRIYSVFERQKEAFLLDLGRVLLVLIVFYLSGAMNLNSYITVFLYSISMILIYLLTYIIAQKIIDREIILNEDRKSNI